MTISQTASNNKDSSILDFERTLPNGWVIFNLESYPRIFNPR